MTNKAIIQELSDLGSSLAAAAPQNIYSVPDGYFDGFAANVLATVRADQFLSSLPKEMPYAVPAGYFDGFEDRAIEVIRNHPDYQTSEEELEAISPLLSRLNKRPVYSVPDGYFENFKVPVRAKETSAKVFSMTSRKWMRYAAAAVVTGVIFLAGFFVYNNSQRNRAEKTFAKFEKELKKIDDVKKTESLIEFMDAGVNEKELASNYRKIKTEDVQQLLQDIPMDELKDFNEQSKAIEDVMMTN